MRFLLWIPICCLLSLGSFAQKKDDAGTILMVGRKLKKPSGGLYLIRIGKDTTYTLLDKTRIIPEDLKFIDFNKIIYGGNKIVCLKYEGERYEIQSFELENSLAEQFLAMVLGGNGFFVVDSLDRSYLSDSGLKENGISLLVFDSLLKKKVCSIKLFDEHFTIEKHDISSKKLRYIYYPDYTPKNVDAKNWTVTLKILDIQNRKLEAFDSVYASLTSNQDVLYFNPRYVRDEKNGKITYLKLIKGKTTGIVNLKIFEWDYIHHKMTVKWDFNLDNPFEDNYKHRINKNSLFIGYDNSIWKVDKAGNRKLIFESVDFKILDFYVF